MEVLVVLITTLNVYSEPWMSTLNLYKLKFIQLAKIHFHRPTSQRIQMSIGNEHVTGSTNSTVLIANEAQTAPERVKSTRDERMVR